MFISVSSWNSLKGRIVQTKLLNREHKGGTPFFFITTDLKPVQFKPHARFQRPMLFKAVI
jgi:hypothetical protein